MSDIGDLTKQKKKAEYEIRQEKQSVQRQEEQNAQKFLEQNAEKLKEGELHAPKTDVREKLNLGMMKKQEANILKMKETGELSVIAQRLATCKSGASAISAEVIAAFEKLETLVKDYTEGDEYTLSVCCDTILRISEALRGYEASHKGIIWFSSAGETRREYFSVAKKFFLPHIQEATHYFVPSDEEKFASEYTVEQRKRAERHIDQLKKNIRRHLKHIGVETLETPEARIKKKLIVFNNFREDLMVYRAVHKDDMDDDTKAFYAQYDELLTESKYISWVKQNMNADLEKDDVRELVSEEAHREAEIEKKEKDYSKNEEIDHGLTEKQLEAVDRIDRWFLRNFNNGGLFGKIFKFLKTGCVDIVNELMSRSKRERLHIYYLIETGKRKDPSFLDVGASQSGDIYVPNLKTFKKQMTSHVLKITTHMTGAYMYWHKLSEAMNATDRYRDLLISVSRMEKQLATQNAEDDKKEEEKPVEEKREQALLEFYVSLNKYAKILAQAKDADKKDKKKLEALARVQGEEAQQALNKLVESDNAVAKALEEDDLHHRQLDQMKEGSAATVMYAKGAGAISGKLNIVSWGLQGEGFGKLSLISTDVGSSLAICGATLAAVANIYTLARYGSNMSYAARAATGLDIVNTAGSLTTTVYGAVEKAGFIRNNIADMAGKSFQTAGGLAVASYVTGGISAVIGATKIGLAIHHGSKTKSAKSALERIRREKEQNITDLKDSEALKRQEKYDRSMTKLAELNNHRKYTGGAANIATGAMTIAGTALVAFPVAGIVVSIAAIGVGIVASIIDAVQMGKAQNGFFDAFVNLPEIAKKVKAKMKQQGRPIGPEDAFIKQLRRKAVTALGFADMASACDQIAKQVADYILDKLFGEGTSDEEKQAYVNVLKGLGVKYKPSDDPNKRRPQRLALAKALSGR